MGLDMYAFTTAGAVTADVGFTPCPAPLTEELDGGASDA